MAAAGDPGLTYSPARNSNGEQGHARVSGPWAAPRKRIRPQPPPEPSLLLKQPPTSPLLHRQPCRRTPGRGSVRTEFTFAVNGDFVA